MQIYFKNWKKLQLLAISLPFFCFYLKNFPSWIRIHSPGINILRIRPAFGKQIFSLFFALLRIWTSHVFSDPLAGLLGQPYPPLYSLPSDPYRSFGPPPPPSLHPPVSSPAGYPQTLHHPPVSSPAGYLPLGTNNSSLSDRLRVGFGEKSPNLPGRGPLIQVKIYYLLYRWARTRYGLAE